MTSKVQESVTERLREWQNGKDDVFKSVMQHAHDELFIVSRWLLKKYPSSQWTTHDLIKEALLSLKKDQDVTFDSRTQFFRRLDHVLDELGKKNNDLAQIMMLRNILGYEVEDVAAAMNTSTTTIKRKTRVALTWIQARIEEVNHD